ncbi:MAG: PTS sugar transporter subunit IIC [Bacillota bacterium]
MKKLMEWIERYLAPAAARISEQRHMASLRDGLTMVVPFLIIGSFATLILNVPIKGWGDLAFIKFIKPYGVDIWDATLGIVSLMASFSIGSSLAQRYKMDGTIGGLMAVAALIVVTPEVEGAWGLPFHTAGWLFTAMITSMLAVEIQHWFVKRNIVIRMPDGVPPAVGKSFSALLPGLAVLLVFVALRGIVFALFHISVNDIILKIFEPLRVLGGSLAGALIAVMLVHLLWSVGAHGGTIVFTIFGPFFLQAATQNAEAFAAGQAAPNLITAPFLDIFVYIGGAGASLGLAILMLAFAKSQQMKALGKIAIGPALFNINEPILFGAPMIMNPVLLIPFVLAPVVLTLVTYAAMASGLVGRTIAVANWATPVIAGGLITTADWRAVVLQLVNVAIATVIYYPFFRAYDRMKLQEENGKLAGTQQLTA